MAHGHAQSTQRRCWVVGAPEDQRAARTQSQRHTRDRERKSPCVRVFVLYLLPVGPNTRMLWAHTHLSHDGQPRLEKSKIDKTPQANSRSHRSSAIARFISPRVALGRAACLLLATPCRAATRAIARGGRAPRGRRGRRRGAWRARRPSRRAAPWRRRLG